MEYVKRVYDAIHGFIRLTDIEVKVIDTCIFQRLRRIRQLGPAEYVYPSATHTRFSHSLGTLFLANLMLEHLNINDSTTVQSVRLAALLHDIGHFPFSHAVEPVSHEKVTRTLIRNYLVDVLSDYTDDIIKLLDRRHRFYGIVSSEVDADRLDYLVRDAYFTGLKYGMIDVEKIIESLTLVDYMGREVLAFKSDSEIAIENLLISRYHMFRRVYYHNVVSGFEALLSKIYEQLVHDNFLPSLDVLLNDKERWCTFDDCKFLEILRKAKRESENIWLREASKLFLERIPLKMIVEIPIYGKGYINENYAKIYALWKKGELEDYLADKADVPREWIIVYKPRVAVVKRPGELLVVNENGKVERIGSRHDRIIDRIMKLFYSPLRIYTDPRHRDKVKTVINKM
ncbi:MAG: hypothetical protein DRJ35_04295, partial [Thermoprotei archaeon]